MSGEDFLQKSNPFPTITLNPPPPPKKKPLQIPPGNPVVEGRMRTVKCVHLTLGCISVYSAGTAALTRGLAGRMVANWWLRL